MSAGSCVGSCSPAKIQLEVCKWHQAYKKPHQVFRLLHQDSLLPSKLIDEACATSARCVRARLCHIL